MRKAVAAAFLGLALAGQSFGGDEPEVTKKPNLWSKWFGKDPKVKTEEADPNDKSKSAEPDEAMLLYQQASKRAQEENEYFRRLEACDRLMEIAITRNDPAMQRQVEELQNRIQEVYNRRTKFLSVNGGKGDEETIEKALAKDGKGPSASRSRFFARDKAAAKDKDATASNTKKAPKEKDQ